MYYYNHNDLFISSPIVAKILGEESKYVDYCVDCESTFREEEDCYFFDEDHAKSEAHRDLAMVHMEYYVFHGSRYAIDECLKPRVSFDGKPLVYATSDYNYALLRAGRFNPQVFSIKEDYNPETGEFKLIELVPGALDYLFNVPGFVYILNRGEFEPNFGTEYVSSSNVDIQHAIKVDNLLAEMKKSGRFEFIEFSDPENEKYWEGVRGGRDGYLRRRAHRVESLGIGMPQEACEPGYSMIEILDLEDFDKLFPDFDYTYGAGNC